MNDTIKCAWCDTMFVPNSPKQKFCSEACKQKNKRKQAVDEQLLEQGLPPTIQASELPRKESPKLPQDIVDLPASPKPEPRPEKTPATNYDDGTKMSPTDLLFEQLYPQYHNYDERTFRRNCMLCGKFYETRLPLLKFCSPQCKSEVMVIIADPSKSKYKEKA